jgi:hypothetical protein
MRMLFRKSESTGKSILFRRAKGAELTSPGQRPGYLASPTVRPEGAEGFLPDENRHG